MSITPNLCELCGLPLTFGSYPMDAAGRPYHFCCPGCRQVFTMLLEITGTPDPEAFRQTDIYRRCRQMGIIPGSEQALEAAVREQHPERRPTADRHADVDDAEQPESLLSRQFDVAGMWCPACAWVIEESLLMQPGVEEARCLFAVDRLRVRYDPVQASPASLAAVVEGLGYRLAETGEDAVAAEQKQEFIRFGISAFLSMNVMMLSFALYSGFFFDLPADAIWKLSWPIAVIATAVLVYGGFNVHRRGWSGMLKGAPGMESLIAIGADCAWGFSLFNLFRGSIHLYFDTAAMLVTLVLLGKMLERKAKDRVQEDLTTFFTLQPRKARLCTAAFPDGRYTAIDHLEPGGVFRSDAGEILPADGRVVAGEGTVNTSAITGEASPCPMGPGDPVLAGSRVERGSLRVRAEKIGPDSTLGQMVSVMEMALDRKTALEGRTDRIMRWFVPIILLLAAATGSGVMLAGGGLEAAVLRAVTVVVISCPCALGIAIPLARVAGIALAGRRGILVRAFEAFESAERLREVVFDKTGTLTEGRWALLEVRPVRGESEARLLALAAGLEADAEHPVAQEIRRKAVDRGIEPADFAQLTVRENGVLGQANGRSYRIGSAAFLHTWLDGSARRNDVSEATLERLVSRVYIGMDGRCIGEFTFGDRLKAGAREAVAILQSRGWRVSLISGDGEAATRAAAHGLGIEQHLGERLPAAKAAFVDSLRTPGSTVAMVGDGVNDAAALAAADLGAAVFSGSPLSSEAADISLMRGDPGQLIDFLELAQRVNRKIVENLFLTFVYNVVSIPVAMSGFLSPLVAVTAMLMSSLSVMGNTLLLVRQAR